MIKTKYCEELNCQNCSENNKSEPCIYKIANQLQEDLTELQQTNEACEKEYNRVIKQNNQFQTQIQEQKDVIEKLNHQILQALAIIQLYKDFKT